MEVNTERGDTLLSPEELSGLIPTLTKQGELDYWERENILAARQWVLSRRVLVRSDPFSEAFLKLLHQRMFGKTWKWAGEYRLRDKNIGVHYYEIRPKLKNLLDDVKLWQKDMDIDEVALRYHHRLVWIHLFPNGNGRHARMVADIVAKKHGQPVFSWGRRLAPASDVRRAYIRSLKAADEGDYVPLIKFARS